MNLCVCFSLTHTSILANTPFPSEGRPSRRYWPPRTGQRRSRTARRLQMMHGCRVTKCWKKRVSAPFVSIWKTFGPVWPLLTRSTAPWEKPGVTGDHSTLSCQPRRQTVFCSKKKKLQCIELGFCSPNKSQLSFGGDSAIESGFQPQTVAAHGWFTKSRYISPFKPPTEFGIRTSKKLCNGACDKKLLWLHRN